MLFKYLNASPALALAEYADIDAFRSSERYARAESMPLQAGPFLILRACLSLPHCSLSLVRTFPRIVKGYLISDRRLVVIPMDQVSSARINGRGIERSLLHISGAASCTVYEPEGRLVAIVSIGKAALERDWQSLEDDHLLFELPKERLEALQLTVRHLLERAAHEPEAVRTPAALDAAEQSLLVELDQAMRAGKIVLEDGIDYLSRYHEIVEKIDLLLRSDPAGETRCGELAGAMGISKRTLHNAVQRICGHSPNRYVRVRRLWMVRNQLCSGASGLTVKSSARAHGFHHMGEFSEVYKSTFGEMPSKTLDDARDPTINPINDCRY